MNREQATQFYLEEVLGLQNLIRPESESESEFGRELVGTKRQDWESIGSSPRHILWTLSAPSSDEKKLISKMMAAAKLDSYIIFWGKECEAMDSTLMRDIQAALLFFGEQELPHATASDLRFFKTATLSSMMEGGEASIQIHKKAAWEKIKELMSFLSGPNKASRGPM